MTSPVRVPETLAATLAPDVLAAIEGALAPPMALRATARVELEIEAAGEGTYTVLIDGGRVSAKKGFAKDPFLSLVVPKGGFALLRAQLQAAVDGFPAAPELRRRWEALRSPRPGELDALVADLGKLKDTAARLVVKGVGTFAVARGPVDEATRVLELRLDASALEAALKGAAVDGMKVETAGDRGVLTAVAAALAPALSRMRGK